MSRPPAMYDTSVSSHGPSDSAASWSSPRSSGKQQPQQQQHYHYFPKSHPTTSSKPQKAPPSQSKLTMSAYHSQSQQKPVRSSDQHSWVSAPPTMASKMAAAASQFTASQQQQQTQQPPQQRQPPAQGSPTRSYSTNSNARAVSPARSVGSRSHASNNTGTYRPDYSRSQHTGDAGSVHSRSGSITARSEPILTEQDRFAAYVNRFAQVDPRMEYNVTASPTHSQSATRRAVQNLEQRLHGPRSSSSSNTRGGNNPSQSPQSSPSHNHQPVYQRQASAGSGAPSNASVADSHTSSMMQRLQPPPTFSRRSSAGDEQDDDDWDDNVGESLQDRYAPARNESRGRSRQVAEQPGTIELSPRGRSPSNRQEAVDRARTSTYHHRSAEPSSPLPSPGSNRTRDLARRFEQRMHAKGRSSQLLQSAMQSAYQQQQQQQQQQIQQQNHSQAPPNLQQPMLDQKLEERRTIPQTPPPKERPQNHTFGSQDHELANSADIETPEPAKVKELKEKLWDDKESLQVRVRPTLPFQQNEDGTRMAEDAEHRGRLSEGQYLAQQREQRQRQMRQTRSLSPKTSRKAYEASGQSTILNHYSALQQQQLYNQIQTTGSEPRVAMSDVASTRSASSGGSGGLRFKSKYFEAAALSSPEWGSQAGSKNSEREALHPAHKSSWIKNGASMNTDDPPVSTASTPKITNEHNVSLLLRKLHSINRQDPSQALAEIDEILKKEALRDDPEMQRALRIPDEYMVQRQQENDQQNEEYESDSDTTVSSITNPTFQEQSSSRGKKKEESQMDSKSKTASDKEQQRRSTLKNALDMPDTEKHGFKPIDHAKAEKAQAGDRLLKMVRNRPAPSRTPPPVPNNTTDRSRASNPDPIQERRSGTSNNANKSSNDDTKRQVGTVASSNSEDLALKIRRWDELSGKDESRSHSSRNKQAQQVAEDLVSNSTEGLGSIVTPQTESPQRPHPWEGKPSALLHTGSQYSAEGMEGVEGGEMSEVPYLPRDEKPKQQSEVTTQNSMNLSNDFDSAWVALPTSKFFPSSRLAPERSIGTKSPGQGREPTISKSPARERRLSFSESSTSSEELPEKTSAQNSQIRRNRTLDMDLARDDSPPIAKEAVVNKTESKVEKPKQKRGLRALLQRGNSKSNQGQSASVSASILAGTKRDNKNNEEVPPPANSRGRRNSKGKAEMARSRSLDDRARNPNIARKFSRMLRVYNDDK